ncbi:MAG: purine permease [Oscillospiraceae bacterium]|nr:purine permease [Oscillospiraceae bacterium]
MSKNATKQPASVENVFKLEGRVPLGKAIPFGLQHILAMFVANLSPITIIAAASGLDNATLAILLQNAMIAAGIATFIQLYPIWKIGSGLPVVMGVSFTFVAVLSSVGASYGYGAVVGAVMIGGIVEGCLGLSAKYWRKLITPIVAGCVVTGIGLSLFTVGVRSFGGGYNEDFGSWQNLLIATITLATCLGWNAMAKGYLKQISVLIGMIVGYIVSIFFGKVDLSTILADGFFSLPHIMPIKPEFNMGAIIATVMIYLVSAAETIGDTTALCNGGLNRDITEKEISGSLAIDGFGSFISSLFSTPPVTSFSQNVGLIAMTKVVNRFTIMTGAAIMVLCGLLPPIANFFASLPDCVLGGCTVMMFGNICVAGFEMLSRAGFTQRNTTIASLSLAIGVGTTAASEVAIWGIFPKMVQDIFSANVVAVIFVVAIVLDLVLPKNMGIHEEA